MAKSRNVCGKREDVGNNWSKIKCGKKTVFLKHFKDPSKYGIDKGKISKLEIRQDKPFKIEANYDRGWDVKPKSASSKKILKEVIRQFN